VEARTGARRARSEQTARGERTSETRTARSERTVRGKRGKKLEFFYQDNEQRGSLTGCCVRKEKERRKREGQVGDGSL